MEIARLQRRSFGLSIGAFALSGIVHAQQPSRARLGWLSVASHPFVADFREGMRVLGWTEGNNLQILYKYADGRAERLPALANELERENVDLIVASGSAAVSVLREPGTSRPALGITSDGWRGSLARPEGNISGISLQFEDVAAKWAELLVLAFPQVRRIGIVTDTSPSNRRQFEMASQSVAALGKAATHHLVENTEGLAPAIMRAAHDGAGALIFASSPNFTANAQEIVDVVRRTGLPAMFESRVLVQHGGLMSYGANLNDVFRRLAWYADRVLRGTKPSDLPVEQPTTFELAINLRTAREMGFSIPMVVLTRAQEVIE